jgi:hypothetical protein
MVEVAIFLAVAIFVCVFAGEFVVNRWWIVAT